MNSVALPVSATAPALGAEVDLIRQAARGNEESFSELYRRHSQTAWRVAQAVAVDRDSAIAAVAEGFGRSLRSLRRQSRLDSETYRPLLLSAVYKAAIDHLHSHSTPTPTFAARSVPKGKGAHSKGANAALLEAAFRSLPERWRAAVWLGDVESMEAERIAAVLGVSSAVASQLLTRGRRGLAGRFAQARRPEPEHLGSALRPLAAAVPANLADEAAARWKALVSDPSARFAPLTGWMNERAVRPLWVSVGALMGLGLIGLGIVGQNSSVNNGGVATGSLPGANSPGLNPLANRGGLGGLAGGVGTVAPNSGLNPLGLGTSGSGGSGGATTLGTNPTGSVAGGGGSGGGGGNTPSSPTNSSNPTQPPVQTPTTPKPTQGQTLLNSPVASVTNSGTTANVNVNSAPTGNAATVTVGCSSGVGLTVGGTTLAGCAPAGPPPPPANTVTGPPSGGQSSATNPVSNVTKTVTNTVTGITSGL
ncbi:MAG TPA: RNA polymerase sigma factor [Acidimicrobiales bacterium]